MSRIPIRLLAEVLAVIGVVQAGLIPALPLFAPNLPGLPLGVLNGVLLVLLAAPTLYWPCMNAVRAAALAGPHASGTNSVWTSPGRRRVSALAMSAAAQAMGLVLTAGAVFWVMGRLDDDAVMRLGHHADSQQRGPVYVAIGGALLSFLMALTVWSLASGRVRADTLARRVTSGLKLASDELVRERQRLENILRGTRMGTWEWNVRTGVAQINDRWAEMLGYARDELGPVTDAAWATHAHPADLQRANVELQRHFNGEVAHYEQEIRLRHKLGHWVWVLSRGSVFQRDADGNAELMAGTHMDIGERKRAEEDVLNSNAMLQAILENLPCGLSVFDGELQLQAHNRRFRTMLGLPDRVFEAGSTTFPSIIRHHAACGEYGNVDVDATVSMIIERAQHPEPQQFERTRTDGRTLDIRRAPLPLGGFVTTYTDVTERRRTEAILRESEHVMRLVTDNIPGRIAYWNGAMQLRFANKGFFDRFGGSLSECVGRDAASIVGADRFLENRRWTSAVLRGEPQRFEREELDAAGEVTHGLTQMIPNRLDGSVQGFVALTLDISFVKRAENELRQANQALAFERDRAEQASLAKGQFLANMSHEIRTPMNAILGMLRLLVGTPLTPRQLDYATKTERAARALLGLLNDILDFSKIEAGKMTLDPRTFSVDDVLRDLSVILSSSLGAKPVEILFDVDPGLARQLIGDDMRLQQVLVNLGGNAIKFTAAGEVVVSVRVVGRHAGGCRLEFAVHDTGIGIAAAQHQHVFSGFAQAEASTTRRFGGTGLGLSICQRLVSLMGSRIELDSEPGRGSTFRFEVDLPVVEEVDGVRGTPLRVLIVDDNPVARATLAHLAESLAWRVDVAEGGVPALVLMRDRIERGMPYEAVFVDWQMPGLDGWQTMTRLREIAGPGAPPLVLMGTARGREELAQRAEDGRALSDGFLVKPVTASMLREAVAEARSAGGSVLAGVASAGPRLAGLRLLVVEDNPNNQQVAQELLEAEGACITLAADGAMGVAAVLAADSPFDAVLMDLQMPVMDGYSAAARIRQRLSADDLPIIAMTANAMASDRAACLAAGMNDHVGKPFDLDELVATLLRCVRRAVGAPAARPRAAPLPTELLDRASRHAIEITHAVSRLGGRADAWARAARSFADQLPGMADEFARLLDQGAWADAGRVMHTLKGLAAMLGIRRLTELAGAAESALQADSAAPALPDLRERLLAQIETSRVDLDDLWRLHRSLIPALPVAAAARDPGGLQRRLRELAALLGEADMAATDVFHDLQATYGAQWTQELRGLGEAVAALDFARALAECRQLSERLVAA